jgi:adenosylcobinamide amidohydrolase
MHWEVLAATSAAVVRRAGRFLVVTLQVPHSALSTSARNGGQTEHLRYLVNHQSCEGSGHESRSKLIHEHGQEGYHDAVCAELAIAPSEAAVMGTAANMSYAVVTTEQDEDVAVTAVVTAGVQTNATCAGDPAAWRETRDGTVKVPAVAGTINTILLVSRPVAPAALARLVVTMTEGKSAALQQLAVPSCYSKDLATGTGTDQFCVAAPLEGGMPLTSASPHLKFGEITGLAVRKATLEALRWQNGLEPSYTRGVFHALGRYGLKEQTIFDDIAGLLDAPDLELLRRNSKSAFYDPLTGAAAHALGTVLDRVRHGTLPDSVLPDAIVQQAATLAASLAAKPHLWAEFRTRLLRQGQFDARPLILAAIALGWSEKWRAN